MIYVYKCEKCGIINSDEKAFNPRTSIECECGNNANRVFTAPKLDFRSFDTAYKSEPKSIHCTDLTKAERQYLGRKGIKGREFDKMTPEQQGEWKEEMVSPSYADNDSFYHTEGKQFEY